MAYDPAWSNTTTDDPRERLIEALMGGRPVPEEEKPAGRRAEVRATPTLGDLIDDAKGPSLLKMGKDVFEAMKRLMHSNYSPGERTPENDQVIQDAFTSAGAAGTGALPFAERGALGAFGSRPALQKAMMDAADRAETTSAARAGLPQQTQATLRAKGVSNTDTPFVREGDRLVPNPTYDPLTKFEDPLKGAARYEPGSVDHYVMQEDVRHKMGLPQDAPSVPRDAQGRNGAYRAGEIPNRWAGPSLAGDTPSPSGSIWMVNAKGEIRNNLEIPETFVEKNGKVGRGIEGWHPLYEAGAKAKELSPEEMAASRHLWGSPTGSLWNQAWMPAEAPQGVKDAVQQVAKGKTWGDVLTETVAKMREAGTPPEEIQKQMPAIASSVARSLAAAHDAAGIKPPEFVDAKSGKSGQSWEAWLQGKWDDALSARLEGNQRQQSKKYDWPASLIEAGERRMATGDDSKKIRERLMKQMMRQVKGGGLQ